MCVLLVFCERKVWDTIVCGGSVAGPITVEALKERRPIWIVWVWNRNLDTGSFTVFTCGARRLTLGRAHFGILLKIPSVRLSRHGQTMNMNDIWFSLRWLYLWRGEMSRGKGRKRLFVVHFFVFRPPVSVCSTVPLFRLCLPQCVRVAPACPWNHRR